MCEPSLNDSTETLDSFSFFQDESQEHEDHSFNDSEIELSIVSMPVTAPEFTSIDSDTDCACG